MDGGRGPADDGQEGEVHRHVGLNADELTRRSRSAQGGIIDQRRIAPPGVDEILGADVYVDRRRDEVVQAEVLLGRVLDGLGRQAGVKLAGSRQRGGVRRPPQGTNLAEEDAAVHGQSDKGCQADKGQSDQDESLPALERWSHGCPTHCWLKNALGMMV